MIKQEASATEHTHSKIRMTLSIPRSRSRVSLSLSLRLRLENRNQFIAKSSISTPFSQMFFSSSFFASVLTSLSFVQERSKREREWGMTCIIIK